MIYNLYKQRGETPLECIQRFAKGNSELKGQKMTYMGRLDPLAEGVLLMASGEDVKRKEEFLAFDKVYDFVSIFGFATDSYDILGKIVRVEKLENINEMDLIKIAKIYEGEREQEYPFYSSKMIAKRKTSPLASRSPLLAQEREGGESRFGGFPSSFRLSVPSPDQGEGGGGVPSKKVTIHKIQFHGLETLNSKELFGRLLMDISKVKGDFRQNEILILWNQILFGSKNSNFPPLNIRGGLGGRYFLGRFSAEVSSGTYIRSLVNDMGKTLGCGATTLSIRRTRVGNFEIKDSVIS